ncbi:MAG: tRNA1(Val) (adenine(37)-N6)-methyltransferase [Thermodesulfovibrionales bacterium]
MSEEFTLDSIRDIRLYQPRSGYRFSVDSLLLFNFINLQRVERIADLGAGCGIIRLLLARKYEKSIVDLFEIQRELFEIARKNIEINSLQKRMEAFNLDMKEIPSFYPPLKSNFDIVVSNPPFRKMRSGRINPYEGKAIARHEIAIDLQGLVTHQNFFSGREGDSLSFIILHAYRRWL